MCDMEEDTFNDKQDRLQVRGKGDVEMNVDKVNLKASQNISCLREVTWEEGEGEDYKELFIFENDIAAKVMNEPPQSP